MTRGGWLDEIGTIVARESTVVRVVIAETDGSTPREAGAAMLVLPDRTIGTIGGGELEYQAIARARGLAEGRPEAWRREMWTIPLGPALGQCCGGRVALLAEVVTDGRDLSSATGDAGEGGLLVRPVESGALPQIVRLRKTGGPWPVRVQRVLDDMLSGARPIGPTLVRGGRAAQAWFIEPLAVPRTSLFIYGAGHVGRALVRVLDGLPFRPTWADTAPDRFPPESTPHVDRLVARDLAAAAATAPPGAWHLVMTYSHPLDLGICHAVLAGRSFGYLGLIGSATKRARFVKRLVELGHPPAAVAERLHCPIGLPDLPGKSPEIIALSIAADLVRRRALALADTGDLRSREG